MAGDAGSALAARLRQIAPRLRLVLLVLGAERVEARLLLVVEQIVEFGERCAHGAHRRRALRRAARMACDAPGRGAWQLARTRRF